MRDGAAIDHRYPLEAADIEYDGRAVRPAAAREGLDAAGPAEQVLDGVVVEAIGPQHLLALQQFEVDRRHRRHHRGDATAARAVAVEELLEVRASGEADGAAVAAAGVALYLAHLVSPCLVGTKKEQSRLSCQVPPRQPAPLRARRQDFDNRLSQIGR